MMNKLRLSPPSPGSKWLVLQRWLVLAIALVIAAMAGYEIKHTPPEYLESASVVFRLPPKMGTSKAETLDNAVRYPSLIVAGDVMVQSLMSPESEHLIREAGGTAAVNLAMLNTNDEEYPAYPYPLATLTAQSASPVVVHRTFTLAVRVLSQLVLRRQMLAAVPARSRMSISLVGDTGPVSQQGSLKRALIALALLAIIAMSKISGWLGYAHRRLASLPVPEQRRAEPATGRGSRRSARSRTERGRVNGARRPAQHRAPRKR